MEYAGKVALLSSGVEQSYFEIISILEEHYGSNEGGSYLFQVGTAYHAKSMQSVDRKYNVAGEFPSRAKQATHLIYSHWKIHMS